MERSGIILAPRLNNDKVVPHKRNGLVLFWKERNRFVLIYLDQTLSQMPFYTYIIQSETSTQLYIGQTNNLEDRIGRHNRNQNKWTRNKGPWKLLYACQFESRSAAVQLERQLKSYKDKNYVIAWIDWQEGNLVDR